jgi:hypothetical protein
LAAIGVDEAVGFVEVEHVGVYAGAQPELQRFVCGADLGDVAGVECGIVPVQREVEPPIVVPIRECRGIAWHAGHGATQPDDLDLAGHLHLEPAADQDVERLFGQLIDVRFLRVVPVAVGKLGVEELLNASAERHHGHRLGCGLADADEALDQRDAVVRLGVVQVHHDHQEQPFAPERLRHERASTA